MFTYPAMYAITVDRLQPGHQLIGVEFVPGNPRKGFVIDDVEYEGRAIVERIVTATLSDATYYTKVYIVGGGQRVYPGHPDQTRVLVAVR